ncbi:MAG: hypothetical protein KJ884_11805 [Gammaproteobacteria bacterium]|nr:hypothetical protein [Gammaproteobacteria bacterium]MBU1490612.1 hypothetical protein [Gammaproteobacteria bacterium]MBU2137453.1 hypothetical protein [Gammaproteobacteria bacterium]MBU2217455.1 hypothetical protein [Gammaproteobacteria bacterium]MBU2323637.1 hypothetical protein [Gammaproteobacteria bacterium]
MPHEAAKPNPQAGAKQPLAGGSVISWQSTNPAQTQRLQEAPGFSAQKKENADAQSRPFGLDFILSWLTSPSSAGVDTLAQPPATAVEAGRQQAGADPSQMPFEEVVSVLGRNENLLKKPLDREGLENLRDNPETPSDARKALDALLKNPDYFAAFDKAKEGKSDGKISSKDVQKLQEHPQIRAYADFKAGQYTDNYVPSDAPPGSPARAMTENDAMRELFLYSESLPKNINMDTLQAIADGSQKMGKCPPQVAAAAKYFTENPDKWQAFSGKDDPSAKISRDRLCDLAAFNVKLSPQEHSAVEALKNNRDIFFKGGGLKPDKLEAIANNKEYSQEVRDAANLLSHPNSMLFSMLDNGKHGAGGNFFNKANDRNISEGDLDAFIRKGTNQVAAPAQPSSRPVESARKDMADGQETQPDQKKEKGGGFSKFLEIFSYVASGLMMLIPGAGVAGAAMAAGRAVGTAVAKEAVKQGTKEAIQQSAKEGAKQGFKEGLKDGAQDFGKQTAQDLGKYGIDKLTQSDEPQPVGNPNIEAPRVWAQS